MNRYWIRIALGSVLVFCLGLGALALVRKGKAEVSNFLASAATRLPLRFANIGFRLDGRKLGELTGVDVVRKSPDDIGRVTGHVELTAADATAALEHCALAVDDMNRLSERTTFYCAGQSELDSGSLIEVGEIRFQPGDFSRPLFLPERVVDDWRRSEIQRLDARMARDGRGGIKASGTFDLRDHRSQSEKGSFELRADQLGAMLSVRDEFDRPLIDLRAGDQGLRLNIRDRHGRNLLRLLADSIGAAIRVK